MKNIFGFFTKTKIIFTIILLALMVLGLWKFGVLDKYLGKTSETKYVLAVVEKGSIITSISGTGQISSEDEVTIKSKASGDVTYIGVEAGDEVSAGKLLLKIDTADALDAIETAEDNLEEAKVDLEKMKGITTDVGTLRGVKEKAQANLDKAYEDSYNTLSSIFLGLPTVMTGLETILIGYGHSSTQWNIDYYVNAVNDSTGMTLLYRNMAYDKYKTARAAYDKNLTDYKETSRSSSEEEIEKIIDETYENTKKISDSVKSATDLIQYYQDQLTKKGYTPLALSTTHLNNLNTYTGTVNGYLTSLLSAQTSLQTYKEALIETDYTIADQEKTIANLEKTLQEAKDDLSNYTLYSPSSGTISAVSIKKGDSISDGATVATLESKQKIAEITLNEVDVANVKVGQKATLTFDAIEDLTLTGTVSEVDTTGTVSQGVVSYTIKISLDTQNDKIKPGMSVSASIITDSKQDILTIPNSAIKTSNGQSYVLVPSSADDYDSTKIGNTSGATLKSSPIQQTITTGLADDTSTEILAGLNEGDVIITRTISATSKSSSTSSTTSSSSSKTSNNDVQRSLMNMSGGIGGPPGN